MSTDYSKLYDDLYRAGYHADGKNIGINHIDYLVKNYDFKTILDAGCSNGRAVREYSNKGKLCYGVDISRAAIEMAISKGVKNCFNYSLTDLPFADSSVDAVVSSDVLEHLDITGVMKAISEINRVSSKYLFLRISTSNEGDTRWIDHLHAENKFLDIENLHQTVKHIDWWILQVEGFGKFRFKEKVKKMVIFTRDGI